MPEITVAFTPEPVGALSMARSTDPFISVADTEFKYADGPAPGDAIRS